MVFERMSEECIEILVVAQEQASQQQQQQRTATTTNSVDPTMILVGCCHYALSNYQRGTTQQQQKNTISPSLLALQKTFTRYNISKRRIDTILTSIQQQQQQQQQNSNSNKDLFPSFLMKPPKKKETVDLPFSTTAKYTMNRAQLLANHYQNPMIECHYLFLSLLDYQPSKTTTNEKTNNNIPTDPSATESNEVWNSVLKPLLLSHTPPNTNTNRDPNDMDNQQNTNVTALDLCQTCLAYYDQEIQRRRTSAKELVAVGSSGRRSTTTVLDDIGMDLTQMAADQLLDTVFGRDTEIDACCRTLLRRKKNSVILLGPAGVGKTAIVEGLAQRLVRPESCPRSLQNVRLVSIEVSNLLANTKYRGEFEERLQNIIDEVTASPTASSSSSPPPRIILFLDEIHTIMGTGNAGEGGGGSIDMANILKPALARGTVQLIGATTLDEYRQSIEKDVAMARRLQPIYITEPNITQCLDILEKSVEYYADYHQVRYTAGAIRAAVELSERYINDRFLPDKAIDLMDEAGAMMQLQQSKSSNNNNNNIDWNLSNEELFMDNERTDNDADRPLVTEEIIRELISEWSGIPLGKIECSEQEKLVSMETILSSRVVGQLRPIVAVARAIRRARSGLQDPQRPIASFMFCGPTGVGKTELCKTLADLYYGSEKDMIRIDMSEYQDRYTVSRLTGPPPGYVGYESGGQLTEAVRRNAHSLILFDEVEKAHEDVLNILLQVLEDGILTDGKGRTVNFKNTIIVMTSNIGSRRILDLCRTTNTAAPSSGLDAVRNSLKDTLASAATMDDEEEEDSIEPVQDKEHYLYPQLIEVVKEELENTMKPELLNRIDEIVVFSPLSPENLIQIAQLNVDRIVQRIYAEHNITLSVADSVIQCIVHDGSMNADQFGARPMRRATQRYVEDSISDAFIQGFIQKNDDAIVLSMLSHGQTNRNRVVISTSARNDGTTTTTEFVVDVADASGGIGAATTSKSTLRQEPINGGYNNNVRDESNTPSIPPPSTKTYPL